MREIRIAFSRWVITSPLAIKDIPFPKLRAILDSIFSGISENLHFTIGFAATPVYQILVRKSLRTKVFFFAVSQLELFYYRPQGNLSECSEIIVARHNKVTVMTLQPFTNEQLNYFKFASVVINEFPRVLRQAFKTRWDNTLRHLPGFQPWDDSVAVRNLFLATEGGSTKVPTNLPYDDWDCTALFQATIFAKSFSMPDGRGHHRTLSYLFVRPHGLPPGGFHTSVISSTGNDAESFTLAIDQLRLLRNAFCHSPSSEISKATFDMYIQLTKDAFQALGVSSSCVNTIGSLTEADFPIEKVRKLEDEIRKEGQAENVFLKDRVENKLMGMMSDIAEANQERRDEAERTVTEIKEGFRQLKMQNEEQKEQTLESVERAIRSHNAQSKRAREEETAHVAKERKEDIQRLENQFQRHNEEMRKEALELKETIRSNIEQSNQAREKDAASAAQERKEEIQELRKQLELATSSVSQQEMSQKLAELNQKIDDITTKTTKQGNRPAIVCLKDYFFSQEQQDNVFLRLLSIKGRTTR